MTPPKIDVRVGPEVSGIEVVGPGIDGVVGPERVGEIMHGRHFRQLQGQSFAPDLDTGTWRRRSSGIAQENGIREDGTVREDSLLVVKIQDNGTVGVLCGRATAIARSQWRPLGSTATPAEHRVILPSLVLGLVYGALNLAADLADHYAGYNGPWIIGLRLTGINGAFAYEYVKEGRDDEVDPYDADTYQKTATASTTDLLETPEAITEQLVGALLRGLSVDRKLPSLRQGQLSFEGDRGWCASCSVDSGTGYRL